MANGWYISSVKQNEMETQIEFEYALNHLAQQPYVKGINHRPIGAGVDPLPVVDVKIDILQISFLDFALLVKFKSAVIGGVINLTF